MEQSIIEAFLAGLLHYHACLCLVLFSRPLFSQVNAIFPSREIFVFLSGFILYGILSLITVYNAGHFIPAVLGFWFGISISYIVSSIKNQRMDFLNTLICASVFFTPLGILLYVFN